MEKKNVNYWKSEVTGCIYPLPADHMPQYNGWTLVSRETYLAWCKEHNMPVLG